MESGGGTAPTPRIVGARHALVLEASLVHAMTQRLVRTLNRKRALMYVLRRALTPHGFLRVNVDPPGFTFRLSVQSGLARHLYKYGTYEPVIGNWMLDRFPRDSGGLFVDIGANFGWYSCLFSRFAGAAGRVIAFEPEPRNFRLLQDSLSRNECRNVTALQEGVGADAGVMQLHLYKPSNPGRHSLLATSGGATVDVAIVSLDDRLAALGLAHEPIALMKIDVEGFEDSALRGARGALARCRCLVMEYSPDLMRAAGVNPAALIHLLAGTGLRPSLFEPGGAQPVALDVLRTLNRQVELLWECGT